MKVCLIYPEYKRSTPLGLLSIAGTLEDEGIEVDILSFVGTKIENSTIKTKLKKLSPDLIGITSIPGETFFRAAQVTKVAKQLGLTTVWGGSFVSIHPLLAVDLPFIDIVVIGEGERTFLDLVKTTKNGKDLKKVKGIAFKKHGQPILTQPRPLIKDLDTLPLPAWHKIDIEKVSHLSYFRKCVDIVTSRGCPFQCKYCYSKTMFGFSIRRRSIPRIIEELEYIKSLYPKLGGVSIHNDTFTIDRKYVLEFCKALRKAKLDLYWDCFARPDTVDRNLLEKMKEAGLQGIYFGVESGSTRMLELLGRNMSIHRMIEVFNVCKKLKLFTVASFMYGIPSETKKDFELTIDLTRRLPFTSFRFGRFVPISGTELYPLALKYGFKEPSSLKGWAELWSGELGKPFFDIGGVRYSEIKRIVKELYLKGRRNERRMALKVYGIKNHLKLHLKKFLT